MIEVIDLGHSYKNNDVFSNVNIKFKPGNIYCLVGENGAGKTTFIELILRMKSIQSGKILFDNKETIDLELLKKIGVVFQENTLKPRLKGKEEIDAYSDLYKVKKEWKNKIIDVFNIKPIYNKFGNSLSGGERRRVLMSLAFINNPEYVILDEPFTGIDTKLRYEIRNFISEYVNKTNATVLFSEHNILECQKYSYNFIFLNKGEFIDLGNSYKIMENNSDGKIKFKDLQELYLELSKGGSLYEDTIKK
ncbi:ATP-binding cassette domain-containing protein [Mammaliicoccus sciuri]|uniref:ATP-binding cassette domain-containing protein n=1 Tax=Mammaliicoccus sciuri TaxID=1296 RepID=UPI0021CFD74E|nr:ABC transporter ATP-binding protein [Mammaliicoccus sciuri]UXV33366.1 ABC transporter ATP-binding protein [Mammaliicoccus sciuri]